MRWSTGITISNHTCNLTGINFETPAKTARKMPEKRTRVVDEQTGEEYDAE